MMLSWSLNYQMNITAGDIATYTNVGERYLRKLFSQYLNLSPVDYLNQIRINKAIELLRNTEMSIKEVCFACGFQSPQYFSRLFKQQMGITPREVTKSIFTPLSANSPKTSLNTFGLPL